MIIGGLQKTTLIDFSGKVACTVFTVGCNFRCPFCHNKDLVTLQNYKNKELKRIKEKDFFEFLEKRKKILDGVCITGGEPTLQPDLVKFCKKIKDIGLEVKLDTNGSNPEVLEKLIKRKLVDFVAMDVKTAFNEYSKAVLRCKVQSAKLASRRSGCKVAVQSSKLIDQIKKTIRLILGSGLEYEFRTTVVPGIHRKETLVKLAKQLRKIIKQCNNGTMKQFNFVLQNFRPLNCLDPKYLKVKPYSSKQMKNILKSVKQVLVKTRIRGIE